MEFLGQISQFIPFSIYVIIGVTFVSIIFYFILRIKALSKFAKMLGIIVMPGIVLHEFSHFLFCKIAGVDVVEISFFHIDDRGVGGYVKYPPHDSFITAFFAGLGPIFINGLLISLLLFYLKNLHEGILYYLVFALTVGACPSNADLKNIFDPFHRDGNKAFIELSILILPIIPALIIGTFNTSFLMNFDCVLALISYFIILITSILIYSLVWEKDID